MTPPSASTQTPPAGIDFGPVATRFTPISDAAAVRDVIERVREIPLVRDTAPLARRQSDITPRERSEPSSRALNAAIAAVALMVLLPVFVIVALLIKLTSPGPVLYLQTRIGLDRRRPSRRGGDAYDRRARDLGGRAFAIYKFRSMYIDAESRSGAVWATKADPRITPLGRFMRKCRIDELPQFINVLLGDMNIVGPRPERPSIFQRLRSDIPDYPIRQRAKPGITGWAQINQCPDLCLDDVRRKVHYDIEYLQRQGLIEDVMIMAKTVPVVLFKLTG
jgi:lipopolysaccharide/colanic/teichoic acid biosynthesis glycosyltransferase